MEELYQKHAVYLKRIDFLCMLNKSSHDFYIKLEDVFLLILRFYQYVYFNSHDLTITYRLFLNYSKLKSRTWFCQKNEFTHPNFDKILMIEHDFEKLIKYIIYVGSKMSRKGYQTEIGEFINMLNWNGYYDNVKR